jgi:hypothetical protein
MQGGNHPPKQFNHIWKLKKYEVKTFQHFFIKIVCTYFNYVKHLENFWIFLI